VFEKFSMIMFGFWLMSCLVLCLAIIFIVYKTTRRIERKNADISFFLRDKVYLPSQRTFETWRGQLQPINMMDLDERIVYKNLQKAIMGELSLRYGDRFSLHYKFPLSLLLQERQNVVDGELRLLLQQSVVDFLICVAGTSVVPAVAIFVWNGSKEPFVNSSVVPFTGFDRRMLHDSEDIRTWAIAGILQGSGVPTFFAERDAMKVLYDTKGEVDFIDSLSVDLQNAMQTCNYLNGVGV